MTYTILAIVVLVVVVLFVLLLRKPDQAQPGAGDKKAQAPEAKPKSIKPGPGPEAKIAEAKNFTKLEADIRQEQKDIYASLERAAERL